MTAPVRKGQLHKFPGAVAIFVRGTLRGSNGRKTATRHFSGRQSQRKLQAERKLTWFESTIRLRPFKPDGQAFVLKTKQNSLPNTRVPHLISGEMLDL